MAVITWFGFDSRGIGVNLQTRSQEVHSHGTRLEVVPTIRSAMPRHGSALEIFPAQQSAHRDVDCAICASSCVNLFYSYHSFITTPTLSLKDTSWVTSLAAIYTYINDSDLKDPHLLSAFGTRHDVLSIQPAKVSLAM